MYCHNCGNKIPDNAKFCNACGTRVVLNEDAKQDIDTTYYTNAPDNESVQRKEVFVGTVKKCPYCGEILANKYGNCPSCGNTIQSQRLSNNLIDFINKVDDCEEKIQRQTNNVVNIQGGYKTWPLIVRILFVLSNFYFLGIPLLIYILLKDISRRSAVNSTFTPAEKELTRLIQNFPFPNDQETMIEAILYIDSKIDFLTNMDYNARTPYWAKLWKAKADELYHKSSTLYKGNTTISNTYGKILNSIKRINVEEQNRKKKSNMLIIAVVGGVMMLLFFFIVGVASSSSYRSSSTTSNTTYSSNNPTVTTSTTAATTSGTVAEDDYSETDDSSYMATTLGNITYVYPIDWGMSIDDNGMVTYINPDMNINMIVYTSPTEVSVTDDDFDSYIAVLAEDAYSGDYEVSTDRVGGHYAKCAQGMYAGGDDIYARFYFTDYEEGVLIVGFLYTTDQEDEISILIRDLLSSFVFAGREEVVYTSTSFGNTNYDVPETWEITEQSSDRIVYQSTDEVIMMVSYQSGDSSIEDDGFVEEMESQLTWDELRTESITLGETPAYYVTGINNQDGGYVCRMYTADSEPGIVIISFYYYPEFELLYAPQIDTIVSSIDIQR